MKLRLENGVCEHIAHGCGGDVRKSMNTVELCCLSAENDGKNLTVRLETARSLTQRSNMRYDRDGDQHYDILSALQKSIRGSDENAAIHYAARLIEAGDIISLSRRLLVIAAEDVGLAYPQALAVVKACVDSAMQLGLPEARIPLADAVILLATAPKSNSAYMAMDAALEDLKNRERTISRVTCKTSISTARTRRCRVSIISTPTTIPTTGSEQQYLPDNLSAEKGCTMSTATIRPSRQRKPTGIR